MNMAPSNQGALRERLQSAYASGTLDSAMRLLVEAQASLHEDAFSDLALAEELAGLFFEAETPAPVASNAFTTVLERISADAGRPGSETRDPAQLTRHAARAASTVIDEILHLPRPVQDLALEAIASGGWTFAGPGLRTLPLELGSGASKAELLRIEPGWGAPRHSHAGGEYTLVLAGSFSDERGRYRVGEIAFAGPDVTHRPVADAGAVCYSLAITDAPLAFTGALGFLQKLWRH